MITCRTTSLISCLVVSLLALGLFNSCQKEELETPLFTDDSSVMSVMPIDGASVIENYDREVIDTQAFASVELDGNVPVLSGSNSITSRTETVWITSREAVRFPATWLAVSAMVYVSDHCGRTKTVYYGRSGITVDLNNRNTSGGKFFVRSNNKYYAVSVPKDANRAYIYRTNTSVYVRFYSRITIWYP